MRNLLSLPAELLTSILSYLDSHDLLNCAEAAKHLSRLILDSSKLQYTISLAKHRLLDILPASTNPPYATRLKLLRDRERAWRDLDWKGRHTLQLPPTGSVYEFVGGIYGNGREDENRVTASISFLELPSSDPIHLGLPKRGLRTWTHSMGDVAIIDFTMDPSQNLLVLVALAPADSKYLYNLHLRTISTNEPHPKAPLPILSCLERHPTIPPPPELFAAVRVQVSGDLVGLLIKEAPDPVGAHLEIWNWENDPYYPCSMSSQHGIDDFTFLSHSSFLVVLPVGRFEVYTFPDPLTSPIFPPSSSSLPTKNGCQPIRKYSYDFPPLSNGYMYWYISMSCNPAPGYVPSQGERAMDPFPSPKPPNSDPSPTRDLGGNNDNAPSSGDKRNNAMKQLYYPLPDERIHACCIYIFNPNNHTHVAAPANITTTNGTATTSLNGNANPTIDATNTNGNNGNNANNNLTDDDLDDDNQQVHSFVFFLNLKTLLDPPEEWFRWSEKADSAKTFAGLASRLGPLWKSPSSPTFTPSSSFSALSTRNSSTSMSSAMFLESSLNALKKKQEEKELRDAKDASGGSRKRKKNGSVSTSSSLSIEIPINGGVNNEKGSGSGPVQVPVLGISTPTPTPVTPTPSPAPISEVPLSNIITSSGSSSTYPPFPQFSSPYTSAIGNRGSSVLYSRPQLATPGVSSSSLASGTATDYDATPTAQTQVTSLTSPVDSRMTITTSNGTRSAPGASPTPLTPSFSMESTLSSSSSGSFPPASPPGSTLTVSSGKTRSSSTPPSSSYTSTSTHTHTHPSTQLNSRSTTPQYSPPLTHAHNHASIHNINGHNHSSGAHRHRSTYSPHHHSQPIPWDVWGPSSTRWFEECLSTDWQHAIYGLRTVESVSVREREKLIAKAEAQREKQEGSQVGKEVQINGALNRKSKKGKEKAEEGVRLSKKGKGKEKEVDGVAGERADTSKPKDRQVVLRSGNGAKTNKGKQRASIGTRIKSGGVQPESEVEAELGNESSQASNDTPDAVGEVPGKEGDDSLLWPEGFIPDAGGPSCATNPSPQSLTPSLSPSSGNIDSTTSINGQQTQMPPARKKPRRFLRIRDFNPYSLKLAENETQAQPFTIPYLSQKGITNYSIAGSGMGYDKGKQHARASSSPPPPCSYSYPYPIHLNINSNSGFSNLNGSPSTRFTPISALLSGTLPNSDLKAPQSEEPNRRNIWGKRRIVWEPSITPVKGVFKKDIVSWLPYTEVMSEETFEVTDVMMDDCRLLLLKRGQMGKLESVEVLMM